MPFKPDASDFQIRICPDSSRTEIAQRLLETHSIALGVTEAMDIWLTHKTSHWDILEDSGVPECDFVILGNMSLGVGIFEYKGRNAVVRIKANNFVSWQEGITSALDRFCLPLASRYRQMNYDNVE